MKSYLLKKNSPEILNKLKELGYFICVCASCTKETDDWVFCTEGEIEGTRIYKPSVHAFKMDEEKASHLLDLQNNPSMKEFECNLDKDLFFEKAKELIEEWKTKIVTLCKLKELEHQ